MTNLEALFEQATKRPWRAFPYNLASDRGNVYIEGPAGWKRDAVCSTYEHSTGRTNEANAAIITVAVNHFAELVAFANKQTRFNREALYGFERGLFDEAEALLARIEAAAKGSQC